MKKSAKIIICPVSQQKRANFLSFNTFFGEIFQLSGIFRAFNHSSAAAESIFSASAFTAAKSLSLITQDGECR